ncbi:MAG: hypothetical protein ILNGONEN_01833 [Syntrophorhabdaceae bacterium]|nr:hypothetical protein [Syntrophorhabdaceae bacterium]
MAKQPSTKPAKKTRAKKTTPKSVVRHATNRAEKLYTLTVYLTAGPMPEEFAEQEVSRTIQIKGRQTLQDLHYAIFDAFDRRDEHLYEFNLGRGPYDRDKIYSLRMVPDDSDNSEKPAGFVNDTTIDDLKLTVGRAFGYAFDFGDDWQHQINVEAISPAPARGKFPRVTKRVRDSPPQYPDGDDDEWGDNDDDA